MLVLRIVATHQKIMKILNFILLPKDKVRRKLWLNAIGRVYRHKDGNVDNKRIWSPKSLHGYVCSGRFIAGKFTLIDT